MERADERRLPAPRNNQNELAIDVLTCVDVAVITAHQDDRVARLYRSTRINWRRRAKAVRRLSVGSSCDQMVSGFKDFGECPPGPQFRPIVFLCAPRRIDEEMSAVLRGVRVVAARCERKSKTNNRRERKQGC